MSGLVTQPMKGAQEGGFMGGLMGFGKGLGGAVFKPAAGKKQFSSYVPKVTNLFLRCRWSSRIRIQGHL
jgi:hypothetical protein